MSNSPVAGDLAERQTMSSSDGTRPRRPWPDAEQYMPGPSTAVLVGFDNRVRVFSVFERPA